MFIKRFNENTEIDRNYFKDKINWKFLNYLQDKATHFEDQGKYFTFSVRVYHGVSHRIYTIFTINKYNDSDFKAFTTDVIDKYNKCGFTYVVGIYDDVDSYILTDKEVVSKYWASILNKSEKVYPIGEPNELVIIPKEEKYW